MDATTTDLKALLNDIENSVKDLKNIIKNLDKKDKKKLKDNIKIIKAELNDINLTLKDLKKMIKVIDKENKKKEKKISPYKLFMTNKLIELNKEEDEFISKNPGFIKVSLKDKKNV